MSDPVTFASTTPRFALPFLIAGQAQKEFYVNEGFARIDAIVQAVVQGTAGAPPASPARGDCWIVGNAATGAWAGRSGNLASWDGGQWTFQPPFDGLRAHDLALGRMRTYAGGWDAAVTPALPSGGSVIDSQARSAIFAIVELLRAHRIVPAA